MDDDATPPELATVPRPPVPAFWPPRAELPASAFEAQAVWLEVPDVPA
jgi:hypothetical protein